MNIFIIPVFSMCCTTPMHSSFDLIKSFPENYSASKVASYLTDLSLSQYFPERLVNADIFPISEMCSDTGCSVMISKTMITYFQQEL
jgi:hypothetical protein